MQSSSEFRNDWDIFRLRLEEIVQLIAKEIHPLPLRRWSAFVESRHEFLQCFDASVYIGGYLIVDVSGEE